MIVPGVSMKGINNELRRNQNELTLLEDFSFFASFAVYDIFHRKERKDSLIGLYAINYRGHREHIVSFLCALCGFLELNILKSPWRGEL